MDDNRTCKLCEIEQPIVEFINKTTKETGRICRLCKNKKSADRYKMKRTDAEFRKNNSLRASQYKKELSGEKKEKYLERCRKCSNTPEKKQKALEYRIANKEKRKAYSKAFYLKQKESGYEFKPNSPDVMNKWRSANADRIKEYSRDYYINNIDTIKCKKRAYRKNNQDLIRAYNKEWRSKNPDRCGELSARRRARKRYATPKWLTEDDYNAIRAFYTEAQRLTLETGIDHAVDHIHPLLGELVCGLHVPWNLQILTKSENSAKGNRLLTEDNS